MNIVNAIITSADFGTSENMGRGFCKGSWIHVDYGGSAQGFGGFMLGNEKEPESVHLAIWLHWCMKCAGVDEWSKMKGRPIRVKKEDGWGSPIIAIGHHLKDIWFDPKEEFAKVAPND